MMIEFEIGLTVSSFIRFVFRRCFPQDYSEGSFQLNFAIPLVMHASSDWLKRSRSTLSAYQKENQNQAWLAHTRCSHA